jgi:hypothetical protein
MAEYHVKLDEKDGAIKAGTLTKEGKWNHKSVVTNEALEAVRDHLIFVSQKEGRDIAYTWQYQNGMNLILKLEAKKTEEMEQKGEE